MSTGVQKAFEDAMAEVVNGVGYHISIIGQALYANASDPVINLPGCSVNLEPAPTAWWTNFCYLAYLFAVSQYIQKYNEGEITCEDLKQAVHHLGQLFNVCNGGPAAE